MFPREWQWNIFWLARRNYREGRRAVRLLTLHYKILILFILDLKGIDIVYLVISYRVDIPPVRLEEKVK